MTDAHSAGVDLVSHARIGNYQRSAKVRLSRDGAGSGAAGAFALLLQAHPALTDWITRQVRAKRIAIEQISTDQGLQTRLRGLKQLHVDFLTQCQIGRAHV